MSDLLQRISVPIVGKRLAHMTFEPTEFGDPHSVRVTLPRGSGNTIILPRRFFAKELGLDRLAPVRASR